MSYSNNNNIQHFVVGDCRGFASKDWQVQQCAAEFSKCCCGYDQEEVAVCTVSKFCVNAGGVGAELAYCVFDGCIGRNAVMLGE